MPTSSPLEFTVALRDFDRKLLPPAARRVGSERFEQAVITYYQRQFAAIGGKVALDMDEERIRVVWTPDAASDDPFGYAVSLLQRGELREAVPLMESLLRADPENVDVLYNLGMAHSDMGQLDEAVALLSRTVELDPDNDNALVALGVAHQREGDTDEALAALREAVSLNPANSFAHRNLGAVLASSGRFGEAEPYLREAVRIAPSDQQAVYGLAATLEKLGDGQLGEADELYQRAISLDPTSQVAELARRARSKFAQESLRDRAGGDLRMDAVMYCLDALKRFDEVTLEQVQAVTLEIALLGRQGLDTNDSTPKYGLKSLPGNFTGLHLVSLMYVGFKRLAPDHDVGFDLSAEYETAQQLFLQEGR